MGEYRIKMVNWVIVGCGEIFLIPMGRSEAQNEDEHTSI